MIYVRWWLLEQLLVPRFYKVVVCMIYGAVLVALAGFLYGFSK